MNNTPHDDTPEVSRDTSKKRTGFSKLCKLCIYKRDRERAYKRHQELPPAFNENIQKECLGCHNSYPATPQYFHGAKKNLSGLDSRCKECVAKYHRDRYYEDIEKS